MPNRSTNQMAENALFSFLFILKHDTTSFFLPFRELKIATINCTIKHSSMRQYNWVEKATVFAATAMPLFENCRTVASYIFACLLAEFSFHRQKKNTICVVGLFTSHTNIEPANEWSKKLCELASGHKRLPNNSAGNKFLLGRLHYMTTLLNLYI